MATAVKLGFVAAFLALAACADPGTSGAAGEGFDDAVSETSFEIELHHELLDAANSMAEVRIESLRHGGNLELAFNDLRGYLAMLDGCPDAPARDQMWQLMRGLEATERGHRLALADATTVDDVRAQGEIYTAGLNELLDRMVTAWDRASCAP